MDTSDDPDITSYHLKNRARSTDNIAVESGHDAKDGSKYSLKNFVVRVFLACVFIGLGIGLLIWSVARPETPPDSMSGLSEPPPPVWLNLARSEACYNGGTVQVISLNSGTRNSLQPIHLPSIWMHNDGQRQLKITLGDRNQVAENGWILDLYFLQYGSYVVVPNDSGVASDFTCYVDWTVTYASTISRLSQCQLTAKNSTTSLDTYVGRFDIEGSADSVEIWTDNKEKPFGMLINSTSATFEYWYGKNMADTVPNIDEDVSAIVRHKCEEKSLTMAIRDRLNNYVGVS